MKIGFIKYFSLAFIAFLNASTFAQDAESNQEESMSELAKKLADPNASIGILAMPIDYIHYGGEIDGANQQSAFKVNFQPSLPYVIKPGRNLFLRPLVPLVISQPTISSSGNFENIGVNLGDIGFDLAYGATWKGGFITIIGVVGSAPSATDDRLGTGRWMLGPELFLGKATKWGMFGALVSNSWSINKNSADAHDQTITPADFMFINDIYYPDNMPDGKNTLNFTSGQYFYTINLKNAWQIQSQPTFTINHNAEKNNRFSIPIGTGVAKTLKAGKRIFKVSMQYWYYVASPEQFGPQHQVRLQLGQVVPLPW